jgi:hypothetical protein
MRKTLATLGLAAGLGLISYQTALAVPADGTALQAAATAVAPLQQAQYHERQTRHWIIKCYRDLVIGPYRCHRYRRR